MGLDIFVMPIWKFMSGQFEAAVNPLFGIRPKRIGAKPNLPEPAARAFETDLRLAIGARWSTEDCVVFAEPLGPKYAGLHVLRMWASHVERPIWRRVLDRIRPPPANAWIDDARLNRKFAGAPTRFPHLIRHADNSGFYVPADFPEPATEAHGVPFDVGSSVRLRQELAWLAPHLPNEDAFFEAGAIRETHDVLTRAAEASVTHRLPIVFDG